MHAECAGVVFGIREGFLVIQVQELIKFLILYTFLLCKVLVILI